MNQEIEAFRDQLREAGQPWSRRGVFICGTGIVGLVISNVAPSQPISLAVFILGFTAMMTGWAFLVVAFLKRRRWSRTQRLTAPALPEPPMRVDPEAP